VFGNSPGTRTVRRATATAGTAGITAGITGLPNSGNSAGGNGGGGIGLVDDAGTFDLFMIMFFFNICDNS